MTKEGLRCVEQYGSDPWVMEEAQSRGDDRRTFHIGSVDNIAIDSDKVIQYSGSLGKTLQPSDLTNLINFAEAILQALPILKLDLKQRLAAEELVTAILREREQAEPDRVQLLALGSALRAIVEGAPSSALTSELLTIWTP